MGGPEIARLSFDVTAALPADVTLGEPVEIVARLFLPPTPPKGRASILTLLHGGSYDWRYFHVEVPGHPGYSMAQDLAARGHIVLALDQLGVGESSRPAAPRKALREVVAKASHAAMTEAYARLGAGTLDPRLPPSPGLLKVGVGHSMGGMQVITEQANEQTYDLQRFAAQRAGIRIVQDYPLGIGPGLSPPGGPRSAPSAA